MFSLVITERIKTFVSRLFLQQIVKPAFGHKLPAVKRKSKAGVKVRVILQPFFDKFGIKNIIFKDFRIGDEFNKGSVFYIFF